MGLEQHIPNAMLLPLALEVQRFERARTGIERMRTDMPVHVHIPHHTSDAGRRALRRLHLLSTGFPWRGVHNTMPM